MTSWEFISMFLFLFNSLHVIITVAGAPSSFLFISLPSVPWTIITAVTLFPFWPSVPFLSTMFSLSFVIFAVVITVPWCSFFFDSGLGKIFILVASFFLSFLFTPRFSITVVIIKYQIIASIKESRKNKLPRKSTHPFGHNFKQASPPQNTHPPFLLPHSLINSRDKSKICFCCHFFHITFWASTTAESELENNKHPPPNKCTLPPPF